MVFLGGMLSPFGGFGLGGFGMAPMAPMGGLFADLNSFGGGGGMNVQTFQTTMGGPGVRSSSTSTKFINGKKITTQRYDSKSAHFSYYNYPQKTPQEILCLFAL